MITAITLLIIAVLCLFVWCIIIALHIERLYDTIHYLEDLLNKKK